jgi:chitinase
VTPEETAFAASIGEAREFTEERRHLSVFRILGVLVLVGAVTGAWIGIQGTVARRVAAAPQSSFAPYVDVTATPQYAFEDPGASMTTDPVLGFVVSAKANACDASWGNAYSLATAAQGLDLDRRVARLGQLGGKVTVSFGGAANSELSIGCTDPVKLAAAYRSVVDRYSAAVIDFDIEGAEASAAAVSSRRAAAVATVVKQESAAGRDVGVWLTLPVGPSGLTAEGLTVLDAMLSAHVVLAGVNGMTMNYGEPLAAGVSMAEQGEVALTALQRQVRSSYAAAGTPLNDAQAWQRIGATAMIGQNDTRDERFDLADARRLVTFAEARGIRRLSMWSANRDQACGPNYADVQVVSDVCSGITQSPGDFAAVFSGFSSGQPLAPLPTVTPSATPSPSGTASVVDDPATSPYAIWIAGQAYPKNTRIVWHRNVYQAKWYTTGDQPDAPVSTAAQTPWTLIGPVLPGEHPAPLPTVSAGTYPAWSASGIYVAGDRVLVKGVAYQAKWWTQGDLPGAATGSSDDYPWELVSAK